MYRHVSSLCTLRGILAFLFLRVGNEKYKFGGQNGGMAMFGAVWLVCLVGKAEISIECGLSL